LANVIDIIVKATDKASGKVKTITKNITADSKLAIGAFDKLRTSSNQAILAAGKWAAAGTFAGVGILGGIAIKTADDFEKANLKYKVLLGSQAAADKRVKELIAFAAKTPFELGQIQQADTLLQGFGIRTEKMLTTIGNASAISGADFTELSLVFGQLSQSKDLENIKQLVEKGVVSFSELKNAGIKFAKDGSIINSVEETFAAVMSITEKKFKGGMEELSQTLTGKLSTMKDNISMTLGAIAQETGLLDLFKDGVSRLNKFMEENQELIISTAKAFAENLVKAINKAVEVGKGLIDFWDKNQQWLGPVLAFIGIFVGLMYAVSVAMAIGTAASAAFGIAIAFATSPIVLIIAAIAALIVIGYLLWKNWDFIGAKAGELWEWIKTKFGEGWEWIKTKSGDSWNWLTTKFQEGGEMLKDAITWPFRKAWEEIEKVMNNIKAAPGKIGAKAGEFFGGIKSRLPGFATGGSFMVGGNGGTDKNLVAFRASRDERVTIETPDQQRHGGGSNSNVTNNFYSTSVNPQALASILAMQYRIQS
jgi:hypothetical protein